MITLAWLAAIAFCLGWHSTNGLLALIAVSLLDIGLTADRIRHGVTEVCRLLQHEEQLTDAEAVVITPPTMAKAPSSPSVVHAPSRDWLMYGTKES